MDVKDVRMREWEATRGEGHLAEDGPSGAGDPCVSYGRERGRLRGSPRVGGFGPGRQVWHGAAKSKVGAAGERKEHCWLKFPFPCNSSPGLLAPTPQSQRGFQNVGASLRRQLVSRREMGSVSFLTFQQEIQSSFLKV